MPCDGRQGSFLLQVALRASLQCIHIQGKSVKTDVDKSMYEYMPTRIASAMQACTHKSIHTRQRKTRSHVHEFMHDDIHSYILQQGTIMCASPQMLRNRFACNWVYLLARACLRSDMICDLIAATFLSAACHRNRVRTCISSW